MEKTLNKQNKVSYQALGEVAIIDNHLRKPVRKDLRIPGKIPYYGANNIQDWVRDYSHDGEYVLVAEDGTNDLVNYSIQYVNGKFAANNHIHIIRGKEGIILTKFLYYYLKTVDFIPYLSTIERPRINKAQLVQIPIPIIPMDVQIKIVHALDQFSALRFELKSYLEDRTQQYVHYRTLLMSEDSLLKLINSQEIPERERERERENSITYEQLGKLSTVGTGNNNARDALESGKYPFYIRSQQIKRIDHYDFDETAIIIPGEGGVGDIFHYLEGKYSLHQRAYRIKLDNFNIKPKFVYYYLKAMFKDYILLNAYAGTVNSIRKPMIEKFPIPILPIYVQEKIVAQLDVFEKYTNNITGLLPQLIQYHELQYQYYRDQLLKVSD